MNRAIRVRVGGLDGFADDDDGVVAPPSRVSTSACVAAGRAPSSEPPLAPPGGNKNDDADAPTAWAAPVGDFNVGTGFESGGERPRHKQRERNRRARLPGAAILAERPARPEFDTAAVEMELNKLINKAVEGLDMKSVESEGPVKPEEHKQNDLDSIVAVEMELNKFIDKAVEGLDMKSVESEGPVKPEEHKQNDLDSIVAVNEKQSVTPTPASTPSPRDGHCGSPLVCRFCLEEEPRGDLIAPCACRGSVEYVHVGCLRDWISTTASSEARSTCLSCRSAYGICHGSFVASQDNAIAIFMFAIYSGLQLCVFLSFCWRHVDSANVLGFREDAFMVSMRATSVVLQFCHHLSRIDMKTSIVGMGLLGLVLLPDHVAAFWQIKHDPRETVHDMIICCTANVIFELYRTWKTLERKTMIYDRKRDVYR